MLVETYVKLVAKGPELSPELPRVLVASTREEFLCGAFVLSSSLLRNLFKLVVKTRGYRKSDSWGSVRSTSDQPLPLLTLGVRRPGIAAKKLFQVLELRPQLCVAFCHRVQSTEIENEAGVLLRLKEGGEFPKVEFADAFVVRRGFRKPRSRQDKTKSTFTRATYYSFR